MAELETYILDQKQLVKDVKEKKNTLVDMCKNRMKMLEHENEVWKMDAVTLLSMKQLHAKGLLELEKSKVEGEGHRSRQFAQEKAVVEKPLGRAGDKTEITSASSQFERADSKTKVKRY